MAHVLDDDGGKRTNGVDDGIRILEHTFHGLGASRVALHPIHLRGSGNRRDAKKDDRRREAKTRQTHVPSAFSSNPKMGAPTLRRESATTHVPATAPPNPARDSPPSLTPPSPRVPSRPDARRPPRDSCRRGGSRRRSRPRGTGLRRFSIQNWESEGTSKGIEKRAWAEALGDERGRGPLLRTFDVAGPIDVLDEADKL